MLHHQEEFVRATVKRLVPVTTADNSGSSKKPNRFTIAWALLFLVGFIIEGIALLNGHGGDTLSEHVWWLLGMSPIIWIAGLLLAIWGFGHFFFKKWTL